MSGDSNTSSWYDKNAASIAAVYEAFDPVIIHGWLEDVLPPTPALVLDVGAGTGRDAAWLAKRGYDVIAVEPSAAMRAERLRRHSENAIRWVPDQLPALVSVHKLGLAFDLILLSGVWQHVAPSERERAMRKLLGLLRPGGILALTLRDGPVDALRA